MFLWLHHLLNPHCSHCLELRREKLVCNSCETLRSQLAEANHEKKQLLARVLSQGNNTVITNQIEQEEPFKQLNPKHLPWPAKRFQLEEADRLRAMELDKEKQVRADIDKRNAELEKEVLGAENHA